MTNVQLAESFETLMKHGGAPLRLLRRGQPTGLSIDPIKTSGGRRPDGLRDDAPANPGFSFAVAELALVIDTTKLTAAQVSEVHAVLFAAGSDDWMGYSHFGMREPSIGEELGLTFSSGYKGVGVVEDVLQALGVPLAELEVVRAA